MRILLGTVFSALVLFSFNSFADDTTSSSNTTSTSSNANKKTSMHSNWICTTNASSSDNKKDQDADNKMSQKTGSAAKTFAFAEKHCRDCTKITCEVKQ